MKYLFVFGCLSVFAASGVLCTSEGELCTDPPEIFNIMRILYFYLTQLLFTPLFTSFVMMTPFPSSLARAL